MSELADMMDLAERTATNFLKWSGEAPPCVIIKLPDAPKAVTIPLPWQSDREKTAMLRALKQMFADLGVTAYAIWSECWMATYPRGPDDPPLDEWPDVMPRDKPDRIDALVIVGVEKGRPPVMRSWQVFKGSPVTVKRLDVGLDAGFGGRLGELLGKPPAN